jgi:hypothetical protein
MPVRGEATKWWWIGIIVAAVYVIVAPLILVEVFGARCRAAAATNATPAP